MKKIIAMIALSAGLLGSMSSTNMVSASSWHKGTPASLRGIWYTKRKNGSFVKTTIKKNYILSYEYEGYGKKATMDNAHPTALNARYKYLGKHIYRIKGLFLGFPSVYTIRYYNQSKLKYNNGYLYRY